MVEETVAIDSLEEIKSYSAKLGIVLYGLRYKKPMQNTARYFDQGISVCDIVAQGEDLLTSQPKTTNAIQLKQHFMELHQHFMHSGPETKKNNAHADIENIAQMADEALAVRDYLVNLRNGRHATDAELSRSLRFFRLLNSHI